MAGRVRGLYEVLISEVLDTELRAVANELVVERGAARAAEVADRVALHLARVVERELEAVPERDRPAVAVRVARRLIETLAAEVDEPTIVGERPLAPPEVLRGIFGRTPSGDVSPLAEPLIPLLDTTLLTNAPGEPRIGSQVLAEIPSADRVDVVMAFIRRSGIGPLLAALKRHRESKRPLRVLTTTYTGSTEAQALDQLQDLGADVRVSYDGTGTRLHAKAWLFHRQSGFSTAYIGSSNLTHSAQVTGLEWNVRVSGARNQSVIDKVAAVFESYWNGGDFVPYDRAQFAAAMEAARGPRTLTSVLSPIELRLEPFQERLLEHIELSRQAGHHRNLLVSATGTGKTVMAAVDYARLRERLPRGRLLFVAHREEILAQSLHTFRHALRDHAFGELWVGGERPRDFDHVFASIQSLNAAGRALLEPDHFDVVIVDEFHHAAASSYRELLEHVKPAELLGLTATPERSDGLPVLKWFGGRIAAELRLWDAIDQRRLVPFAYYGVHDGLDLTRVGWRRGRGYDVGELTNLLTADHAWARLVIKEVERRVDDLATMRALGFCVSVEHARFMAKVFSEHGIRATAIWSDTPDAERRRALEDLAARRVNVVFSVDLFNEGVDVPAVDTLLMLRPTESPTLFLQQLGRGLRRSVGKAHCTVLDFVGHQHADFRFDRKLRALLGGSRADVQRQVEQGFPFLPAGCHFELDRVASEVVLRSIKQALPTRWAEKAAELARLGAECSLSRYLEETGLDLEDVYAGDRSWSDLREAAGLPVLSSGTHEESLRRACGRLLHVDDRLRLSTYRRWLASPTAPEVERLDEPARRLLRMLVSQVVVKGEKHASLQAGADWLWRHAQVLAELLELFSVLEGGISHVPVALAGYPLVPLQVHAQYTRLEILSAFGVGAGATAPTWQTGAWWAEAAQADLLAFTFDKTSGSFSPTTRYKDFAISRELIHWQSQSATAAQSPTGQRYQHHAQRGSHVMLFARLRNDDRAFTFLGPASYVSHESERPMSITWRLVVPLPGDLFAAYAAAVA
jgi:superfamily II DNA or RNA helicase/HKD family nuclease